MTGLIVEISVAAPTTFAPAFTVVAHSYGPPYATAINDGAACIGKPVDLGIVKTAPATVSPNGTITWVLTVTNYGPGNSSGYVVDDTIPAGITNLTYPANCTLTGHLLQCVLGTLQYGNSFSFIVTGTAPATAGTCVTNAASVTGNEADPNAKNNSTSVQTCTSGGGSNNKNVSPLTYTTPGQTLTYTFTITNTAKATTGAGPDVSAFSDVTEHDAMAGLSPINCDGTGSATIPSLAAGESETCTADYTTTSSDVTRGEIVNIATATAVTAAGHSVSLGSSTATATAVLYIATTTLANEVTKSYFATGLVATGGTKPYTWSLVSGRLPPGVRLSTMGVLSGTPTAKGKFSFEVMVKDTKTKKAAATTTTRTLSLTIT